MYLVFKLRLFSQNGKLSCVENSWNIYEEMFYLRKANYLLGSKHKIYDDAHTFLG